MSEQTRDEQLCRDCKSSLTEQEAVWGYCLGCLKLGHPGLYEFVCNQVTGFYVTRQRLAECETKCDELAKQRKITEGEGMMREQFVKEMERLATAIKGKPIREQRPICESECFLGLEGCWFYYKGITPMPDYKCRRVIQTFDDWMFNQRRGAK